MTFKVANIISRFNAESGGPPRTVSQMAAAGTGHWQADLFTTDYRESSGDTLLVSEFPGHATVMPSMSRTLFGGLSMMSRIREQLLQGITPDVVHIHGVWSPYLAAFALTAARNGIPFIITPHGMLEPWSLRVRATRKWIAMMVYQRKMLARASAIHATSEMEADNLRRLKFGNAPVFVVPNTVAEPPPPESKDTLLPGEKRILLFLSRVHEKKGLDILLQAWNEIRPLQWRLLIVGSGDPNYVGRLKSYCSSNNVPDVEFVPHVDGEVRETIFRRASAFVLPTYSENFGNAIAEALIRGLPVITTTGTPWSGVIERKCGWYIEPTVGELKRVIAEVTSTTENTLAQMGARGREYATKNFTLPVVREGLLNMYESVIDGRTDP